MLVNIRFYHIHRPNTAADMEEVAVAFRKVFMNLEDLRAATGDFTIPYKW